MPCLRPRPTPRTFYTVSFLALVAICTYGIWTQQNYPNLALGSVSWKAYELLPAIPPAKYPAAAHPSPLATSSHSAEVSTPVTPPPPPTPSSSPPAPSPSRPPKITVIAIWTPRNGDLNYLPYFFQSVEANPKVNLLFVNVISETHSGCTKHSNATNVQELCLEEKEYYDLHVDYLCKEWVCSDAQKKILHRQLSNQRGNDYNYSFFRIVRSGIFAKWINPATTIWGWCDLDTFWGNFERTFPWDLAPNYDVIAITSQPDFGEQRLLFTRGHMAFFRHSPETLKKLRAFPSYASFETYLLDFPLRADAEESQFSHYYFASNEAFTYLHVEGMIEADTIFVSDKGTYYTPHHKDKFELEENRRKVLKIMADAHAQSTADDYQHPPSFSPSGVQKLSPVKTEGYWHFLWFPDEYAAYYQPDWQLGERENKGMFMRNVEHGPTEQRLELRDRFVLDKGGLDVNEALYKHWHHEKHHEWFRMFPARALPPGHTMVLFDGKEGVIWDAEGNTVFETGKDEEKE